MEVAALRASPACSLTETSVWTSFHSSAVCLVELVERFEEVVGGGFAKDGPVEGGFK